MSGGQTIRPGPSGSSGAPANPSRHAGAQVAARLAAADSLRGKDVLVLGLGHFGGGLGAAQWLLAQGARVTVTDKAGEELLAAPAAALRDAGARVVLGGHAGIDFGAADLLVVNPAVPLAAPPVMTAAAAGVKLSSEIGLLMERWPGPLLGVTGSNGKSTTTSLAHALLGAAGARSALGGNIGGSLLERLADARPGDVAVLELSSFMLDMLARQSLGPDVALITNITPNHLDRHGSFEAYKESKRSILAHARRAVLNADDGHVRDVARGFDGETLWFGAKGDISVGRNGELTDRRGWPLIADADVPLPGRMNRMNIAAATLAVSAVLADEVRATRALPAALAAYERPPHRLQPVGTWGGVAWVDDSSSTTPESTHGSLQAVGAPCILIVGGHDKGLDPAPLLDGAQKWARLVLTIGEQSQNLLRELTKRGVLAEAVGTVQAAVERAAQAARPGDTVLLSPGYSSHDQFTNYEKRAECFRREALSRAAAQAAATS